MPFYIIERNEGKETILPFVLLLSFDYPKVDKYEKILAKYGKEA